MVMSPSDIAETVDARGLACPLPLLKARQALNAVNVGQCVQVVATDAASERDFHSFVELTCHTLVDFNVSDDTYTYLIRKGETP